MKRSCVVPLVVAALAFVVLPGCSSPGPKPHKPGDKLTVALTPPGLAPGLIQISRSQSGGPDVIIGYAYGNAASEVWVLKNPIGYPVPLNVGDYLKFQYLGPQPSIDTTAPIGEVSSEELCKSMWGQGCIPASKRTVLENVTMDGTCDPPQ
jgi:hypothetical protein